MNNSVRQYLEQMDSRDAKILQEIYGEGFLCSDIFREGKEL